MQQTRPLNVPIAVRVYRAVSSSALNAVSPCDVLSAARLSLTVLRTVACVAPS